MIPGLEWSGSLRCDGLSVESGTGELVDGSIVEAWRVVIPGSTFLICCCPCCGGAILSQGAAIIVANKLYPFPVGRRN